MNLGGNAVAKPSLFVEAIQQQGRFFYLVRLIHIKLWRQYYEHNN